MSFRQWVVFVALQWSLQLCLSCPKPMCDCKWKGGKQTVECIKKNLNTIPDGLDHGTQVLDLSWNSLLIIPHERFYTLDLINLQRIYLSNCHIGEIDDRAFRGLTNLVELDLSVNRLSNVPSRTFRDFPTLMRLTISNNPIRRLFPGAFEPLSYLITLELSGCEIDTIDNGAFSGLDSLEWLKLDANRLTTIGGKHIIPESLHGIDLHKNPWHCDCHLVELRSWLLNYNIPYSIEPRCVTPERLEDEIIKTIEMEDFACLPDVSPTTMYLEIQEGKNFSLLCSVSSIPEAKVSWWFQGRVLQNGSLLAPGLHLYYFVEEGAEEKKSELFIYNTNTEDNGTFVCVAENPAGKSQSNYTVRIVVKEDIVIPVFPYEYVIAIISAIAVLVVLILITLILLIIKCRRQRRRRKKKERSKTVALQGKSVGVSENKITRVPKHIQVGVQAPSKLNGTLVNERRQERNEREGPLAGCAPYISPSRNFQEQNPDLINDTESVGKERRQRVSTTHREDGDGEEVEHDQENSGPNSYQEAMENIIDDYAADEYHTCDELESKVTAPAVPAPQWRDDSFAIAPDGRIRVANLSPPSSLRDIPLPSATLPRNFKDRYQHAADVHLAPGRFLDSDGYPLDFGLPKVPPLPSQQPPEHQGFYRTLPHSRGRLSHTSPTTYPPPPLPDYIPEPSSYDPYIDPSNIRYSADGLPHPSPPMYSNDNIEADPFTTLPSPPAPYKGEPTMSPQGLKTVSATSPVETVPYSAISPPPVSEVPWPGYAHTYKKPSTPGGIPQDIPPVCFSDGGVSVSTCCGVDTKRSGVVTENASTQAELESDLKNSLQAKVLGPHQESPDEGYEDEGGDGTEI